MEQTSAEEVKLLAQRRGVPKWRMATGLFLPDLALRI
jgi:hypothetical protein